MTNQLAMLVTAFNEGIEAFWPKLKGDERVALIKAVKEFAPKVDAALADPTDKRTQVALTYWLGEALKAYPEVEETLPISWGGKRPDPPPPPPEQQPVQLTEVAQRLVGMSEEDG